MAETTTRTRSPNFPLIDLEAAVEFATKLERIAKRHPLPTNTVIEKVLELKAGSSRGFQCIGALKQFGLIEDEGSGESRRIKLTETGAKIVHNHPERSNLLREAALNPKVHSNVLAHFGNDGIPPDDTIRHYLLFDHDPRFNSTSVDSFLGQFRATIEFAKLDLLDPLEDNNDQDKTEPKKRKTKAGMREDIFTLDEGQAVLQWPEKLSRDSYEDLESWLSLVLRKAKRAISDDKDSKQGAVE